MYVFLLTTDTTHLSRMAEGRDRVKMVSIKWDQCFQEIVVILCASVGTSPSSVTFVVVDNILLGCSWREVHKDSANQC